MVSTHLISKSSSPFNNHFNNQSLHFTFWQFYFVVSRNSKVHYFASSLFFSSFFIIIKSGLLAEIMWFVRMSKSKKKSLCVSFSRIDAGLCIYHLFVWLNWNIFHNSLWITLPTQSCLFLYSFCVKLLHSLIIWLVVLSLSPYNLHLLFSCVLSILALIWLVLMALFCDAIWILLLLLFYSFEWFSLRR